MLTNHHEMGLDHRWLNGSRDTPDGGVLTEMVERLTVLDTSLTIANHRSEGRSSDRLALSVGASPGSEHGLRMEAHGAGMLAPLGSTGGCSRSRPEYRVPAPVLMTTTSSSGWSQPEPRSFRTAAMQAAPSGQM